MNENADIVGAALAGSGVLKRSIELLHAGGPVVALLLALSVVALAIVLAKLWQFHVLRLGDRHSARRMLDLHRAGRSREALAVAETASDPAAQALARALRGQRRGVAEAAVREEIWCYGSDVLEAARSWLRPLEVIGALAPLIGLLGTVLGMIEAFRQLEQAGSRVDPAILSGGIWEALLTTAVGLAVAIPVIVVHNWLERRVEAVAQEIDSVVARAFTEDLSDDAALGKGSETRHEPAIFDRTAPLAGE